MTVSPVPNPDLCRRKHVIFDLFHTLSTIRHAGVPGPETHQLLQVSRDQLVKALFEGSEERLRGAISDPVEIIADIARRTGSLVPDSEYSAIAQARAFRFAESLRRVAPATLSALDGLRSAGKRLALVSNADSMEAAGWHDSPLSKRIDVAIFSCEAGIVKPEPQIYDLCLRRLGATARDALFVGDGGSNEFAGARSVGLPTICTTEFIRDIWPEQVESRIAAADHSIDSLDMLMALVANTVNSSRGRTTA